MSSTRLTATPAHLTVFALVAALLGALLAVIPLTGAQAAGTVNYTVAVTSKAGTALSGLTVAAVPIANRGVDPAEVIVNGTPVTGKAGSYLLAGLETDVDYTIYFSKTGTGTFDQFLGGSPYIADAETFSQAAGGSYTLATSLATNSIITGKVVGAKGVALKSVTVTAYQFDGSDWKYMTEGLTGSTGVYSLRNLDPGSYKLEFDAPDGVNYLTGFSGSKPTLAAATPVYVALGATATSNVTLLAGGTITGKVRFTYSTDDIINFIGFDPGPQPADGVRAYAYRLEAGGPGFTAIDWDVSAIRGGLSGTTGTWSVNGLPTGDYVVKLYDEKYGYSKDRWVGPGGATTTASSAQVFSVVAGASRSATATPVLPADVDTAAASTTLTVRNTLNQVVVGAEVIVFENGDEDYYVNCEWVSEDECAPLTTNSSGQISLTRMPIGSFDVIITHPDYQTFYETRTTSSTSATTWSAQLQDRETFDWATAPFVSTGGSTYVVGENFMLTANTTLDDGTGVEADVSYEYQWYRDGRRIAGATNPSYVSQAADVGTELSVIVRAEQDNDRFASDDRSIVALAEAGTPVVEGDQLVNTLAPWISSPTAAAPKVVLTANSGVWSETGVRFTYQWLRDGNPIPLATARTYTLTELDASTFVSVELVAIKPGHPNSLATAATPVPVAQLTGLKQTVLSTTSKTTTGVAAGSTKYTVTPGKWNLTGVTPTYEWHVDGVTAGFGSTITLNTEDVKGAVVDVVVIGQKTGWVTSLRTIIAKKATTTATVAVTEDVLTTPVDGTSQTQVGTVLRATPTVTFPYLSGGSVVTKYSWQRSTNGTTAWATITGATAATYTLSAADTNKFVRVVVTITSTLYDTMTITAPAGKAILSTALSGGVLPSILVGGSGAVTTPHTATVDGSWPVSGVTLAYQWFTCAATCGDQANWSAVVGATKSVWTPPASAATLTAFVRVTASKSGHLPAQVFSSGTALTTLTQPTALIPAVLAGLTAGDAVVGKPVTVKPGVWDAAGITRVYIWQVCDLAVEDCLDPADWSPIGTTTKPAYTPTAANLISASTRIRAIESVARTGLVSAGTFTDEVDLVPGSLTQTVAPKIVTSGGNYSVSGGTWLPAGDAPTFEWFEDGVSAGAGASLPIPPGTTSVHVVVTVSRDGYTDKLVTLVARKGTITPNVEFISGSHVAQALSVPDPFVYPATSTPGAVKSYQWYSNGVAIKGATASTFTPSYLYVGKKITVRIISRSAFYNDAIFNAASGGVVIVKADAPLGNPTMISSTGLYQPGAKLSVDPNLPSWDTTGLTFSYQWQISTDGGSTWSTVSTASTYTLLTSQPTQRVQVVITAKKPGYTDRVQTRGTTVIDWLGPLDATTPPLLSGPASNIVTPVGTPLTVTTGFWNAAGLTFSYEWLRDGVVIPGVTGSTFTPTAAYYGDQVQVIVTAKAAGYEPVTALSNVVIIGQAAAPTTTAATLPKITKAVDVLSATTGIWNVDGLTFTYQWRMDGSPIVGATGPTLSVTEPGTHAYTVVVTATRDGYANGTAVSAAVTASPV